MARWSIWAWRKRIGLELPQSRTSIIIDVVDICSIRAVRISKKDEPVFHVIKDDHCVDKEHMDVIHACIIGCGCWDGLEVFYPVPPDVAQSSSNKAWQARPVNKAYILKNFLNDLHRFFTRLQFCFSN